MQQQIQVKRRRRKERTVATVEDVRAGGESDAFEIADLLARIAALIGS